MYSSAVLPLIVVPAIFVSASSSSSLQDIPLADSPIIIRYKPIGEMSWKCDRAFGGKGAAEAIAFLDALEYPSQLMERKSGTPLKGGSKQSHVAKVLISIRNAIWIKEGLFSRMVEFNQGDTIAGPNPRKIIEAIRSGFTAWADPTACQVHKWYDEVLLSNAGKRLYELGIKSFLKSIADKYTAHVEPPRQAIANFIAGERRRLQPELSSPLWDGLSAMLTSDGDMRPQATVRDSSMGPLPIRCSGRIGGDYSEQFIGIVDAYLNAPMELVHLFAKGRFTHLLDENQSGFYYLNRLLFNIRRGIMIPEPLYNELVKFNQSQLGGPDEILAALTDEVVRGSLPDICQVHRWYNAVFQASVGRSISQLGTQVMPFSKYGRSQPDEVRVAPPAQAIVTLLLDVRQRASLAQPQVQVARSKRLRSSSGISDKEGVELPDDVLYWFADVWQDGASIYEAYEAI